MKLKKVLAGILSAAMVLGTMVVPAAASAEQVELPNVTNYNTPYTRTFTEGAGTTTLEFMVQGASADYMTSQPWASPEEADNIEWSLKKDLNGVSITGQRAVFVTATKDTPEGYVSVADVSIDYQEPGLVVLQATSKTNPQTAYMDFTLLVNSSGTSAETSVSNVTTGFYNAEDGGEGTFLGSLNSATVSSANFPQGPARYPNPLCLPATWGGTEVTPTPEAAMIAAAQEQAFGVKAYRFKESDGSYTLNSITFNLENSSELTLTAPEPSDEHPAYTLPGWQYRVYKLQSDGTYEMDPISVLVGASVYQLEDNDMVVWKYGTYADTIFPETL